LPVIVALLSLSIEKQVVLPAAAIDLLLELLTKVLCSGLVLRIAYCSVAV
jgi:hypothetical protein